MTQSIRFTIALTLLATSCAVDTTGTYPEELGGAPPVETTAPVTIAGARSTGGATSAAGGATATATTQAALGGSPTVATTVAAGGSTSRGGSSSTGGTLGTVAAGGTTSAPSTYVIIGCPGNCKEINLKDQDLGVLPTCNLRCGITGTVTNYAYLFGFRAKNCYTSQSGGQLTTKQMEQWDYSPVCLS